MIWQVVLRGALVGAVIGAVVALLYWLFVRKACPHCAKRFRLGMWKTRQLCPHCGGVLKKKPADK